MDAVQPRSFGTLLRRYRIAAGSTQEELAERAGVSVRRIGDLERGVQQTPHKTTVALLAEALGLAASERAAFEAAARRHAERAGMLAPALPRPTSMAAPPFVGRTQELALLEGHLGGEGMPVLLLAGEPGIGKSRLLLEAAQRAPGQGWTVLAGGCQRRGGQEPYAPLLEALKGHMQSLSPAALATALRECSWLVRLLPELAGGPIAPLPTWTVPPEQERRLMFEAVARFLGRLAGPAGTLLVLDDLQWAGSDALDLLSVLVRSLSRGSAGTLRVLGAYRDTEVRPQDALSVALTDLAHADLAAQMAIGPLSPADVHCLLVCCRLSIAIQRQRPCWQWPRSWPHALTIPSVRRGGASSAAS